MHLISQTLKIAHIIYSFTRPTLFPEIIKPTPSLWELTLHGQILSRHKYQTPQFPSLCHLHLSRSIALPWYGPAQGKETSTLVVIGSAAPNLTHLCVSGVSAHKIWLKCWRDTPISPTLERILVQVYPYSGTIYATYLAVRCNNDGRISVFSMNSKILGLHEQKMEWLNRISGSEGVLEWGRAGGNWICINEGHILMTPE